ncbi:MAG: prepilin-type N-terminal cleavage/methylation domain-containing protein [Candidatus Paceibacterota bacterium]
MNTHCVRSVKSGFTLVELLVVIFIIGVLSAVIFPGLSGMREKARDTERVTDVMQIRNALEQHFNRNGSYPPNLNSLDMPSMPKDPQTGNDYSYQRGGSCGGVSGRYLLRFTAENAETFEDDTSVVSLGGNNFCVAP